MAKLIFSLSSSESLDFPLNAGLTRLGRHEANEIVIDHLWISSFHAEFRREGGCLIMRDLQSSNGTSVNGTRFAEHHLKHGDRIAFGQLEAVYDEETQAGAGAPMAAPMAAAPARVSPLVVPRPMMPPPATIAYDTARKEAMAELEVQHQKIKEATSAAAAAHEERLSAESALAAAMAAQHEAEGELVRLQEAAQAAAREASARSEAEQDAATRVLAALQQEIFSAAAERDHQRRNEEVALAAASAHSAAVRNEVEGLQQSVDRLRREHAELSDSFAASLAATREQTHSGQKELSQLQILLEAARRDRADVLAAREALLQDSAAVRDSMAAAAGDAFAAREKIIADTVKAQTALDSVKAETGWLTAGLEDLEGESHRLREEAEQWLARGDAAGVALTQLQEALASVRDELTREEENHAALCQSYQQKEVEHHQLASQVQGWQEQAAAAARQTEDLAVGEATAAALRREIGESEARRNAADAAAAAAAGRQAQHEEQIRCLEALLEFLHRETDVAAALHSKVIGLRQQQAEAERRLDLYQDQLAGMSGAPDPNWGTVHSLARSFIKKLDLIDDLLGHLATQPESAATLEQLEVFRAGLLDLLKAYSIEAFSLEPGTVIDVAARKRIQIVETLSEGRHEGTRIVRTYRPGYVCLNGSPGIPTLLRKADVAVSVALSEELRTCAP